MRIIKEMPSFQAVAAGQTALCNLPLGMTYNALLLRYKANGVDATAATIAADIAEVRVKIDGRAIITASGAELVALLDYYAVTWTDGVLPLLFARHWQRTLSGEDEPAIGTAGVQTFSVEVDLAAGANNPVLSAYAWQSANAPLGQFVGIYRFGQSWAGAAGDFEIADLPRDPRYGCLAVHFTTANISRVAVEANQRIIYEADTAVAKAAYRYSQVPRKWQAGYWHVDFAPTNRLGHNLPLGLQDWRFRLSMTGATPTFRAIMERVEGTPSTVKARK